MKFIGTYKTVLIEQNQATGKYCGTFGDGSWYGWCETENDVKRKADTNPPEDADSHFACLCDE